MPVAVYRIIVPALLAALVAACGGREERPRYVESEEVHPLEVPADLSRPDTRRALRIPGESLPQLAGVRDESSPPEVLPSAEVMNANSRVLFSPRGLYLQVDDRLESVWRRLGFSLNRDGMNVLERDPDQHIYRFRFSHDPVAIKPRWYERIFLFRGTEYVDYSGEYQVELVSEDSGDSTRVHLMSSDGGIVGLEEAEYVLSSLRDRLG